jgi:hypothetical protein
MWVGVRHLLKSLAEFPAKRSAEPGPGRELAMRPRLGAFGLAGVSGLQAAGNATLLSAHATRAMIGAATRLILKPALIIWFMLAAPEA